MASPQPQQLLGYVIGALDDAERRRVEDAVSASPALQRQAAALAEQAGPLLAQRRSVDPPPGLAARTCKAVALAAHVTDTAAAAAVLAIPAASLPPATPPVYTPTRGITRWRWPDAIITASIAACSLLLLIPTIYRAGPHVRAPDIPRPSEVQGRLVGEQLRYDEYLRRQGEIVPPTSQASPVSLRKAGFGVGCRSLFPEGVLASPNDSDWLGAEDLPSGPVSAGASH